MGLIREAAAKQFDGRWAVAPVPARRSATSYVGGANWAVFQASPKRAAAWKFVEWMAEPRTQAAWYEISSDLPANQAAWRLPALSEDPRVRVFGEQLKHTKAPVATPRWERMAHALETELESVLRGTVSGAEAAKQLAASVRAAAVE